MFLSSTVQWVYEAKVIVLGKFLVVKKSRIERLRVTGVERVLTCTR
jgi:hypothetical protein